MSEATAPERPLRTRADYEAAIEECLAEMKRVQTQIDQDQIEIDRLRMETRAILDKLKEN